jgi:O-antigen/teichoic acid export membrane protein
LCRTVGLNLLSPFAKWPVFAFRGTSGPLVFGGNVTATRIMWFFYSQADIIIGGRLLGKDLLGLYSVAMHLASLPARKSSAIINQVSFPAFARIQHDQQRYASTFLLAVRSLSFVLFPVLWGMSSVAPEMVPALLGDKWTSATVSFQLLALIMPIHMFAPFMNTAAQGLGRADIAAKQVFVASLVMPAAFVVGSHWGLTGLATAWLVGFPVVFIVAMRLFLPVIGLRVRDLLVAMARPVLASAGMAAGVTLVRIPLESGSSLTVRLTVLVVAGAVTYATLTWFTNKRGYMEIVGMIKG